MSNQLMKFKDLKIGDKFKLGTLIWTKIESCETGPWLPQNAVYCHPETLQVHTEHMFDDYEVEYDPSN